MKCLDVILFIVFSGMFFGDLICREQGQHALQVPNVPQRQLNPYAPVFIPGHGMLEDAAMLFPHVYSVGEYVVRGEEVWSVQEAQNGFVPDVDDDLVEIRVGGELVP